MPQPDPDQVSCPVCGQLQDTALLPGHLQTHDRDGGGYNPPPQTKAWPPQGIETK